MTHAFSTLNKLRRRNLNARAQKDARRIIKRGTEGGPVPVRTMLSILARVVGIGLIKAGLDNEGHHEFRLETALKRKSKELNNRQLAREIAKAEYALQSNAMYAPCRDMFNSFVKKHEPREANWQDRVTQIMNKALIDVVLKK